MHLAQAPDPLPWRIVQLVAGKQALGGSGVNAEQMLKAAEPPSRIYLGAHWLTDVRTVLGR